MAIPRYLRSGSDIPNSGVRKRLIPGKGKPAGWNFIAIQWIRNLFSSNSSIQNPGEVLRATRIWFYEFMI